MARSLVCRPSPPCRQVAARDVGDRAAPAGGGDPGAGEDARERVHAGPALGGLPELSDVKLTTYCFRLKFRVFNANCLQSALEYVDC